MPNIDIGLDLLFIRKYMLNFSYLCLLMGKRSTIELTNDKTYQAISGYVIYNYHS